MAHRRPVPPPRRRPPSRPKSNSKNASPKKKLLIALGVIIFIVFVPYNLYRYMNYVTSRDWYEQANEFMEKGEILNAERCLHNALIYDREYSDAYLLKAQVTMSDDEFYWGYVTELLDKAILYADEPTELMYHLRGKSEYYNNEYKEAVADMEKAIGMGGHYDSSYFFLGKMKILSHVALSVDIESINEEQQQSLRGIQEINPNEGEDYLASFIEKYPTSGESQYLLGLVALSNSQDQEVENYFKEAVSNGYETSDIFYNLGRIALYKNDTSAACKQLIRAVEMDSFKANKLKSEVCD